MSRRLRLAIFDLDGVLVEEKSSWAYLHKFFGSYERVRRENYGGLFERGTISYSEWMKLDLEAIISTRGEVLCDEIARAFERIELVDGAREVVDYLRGLGVRVAVVSAGIDVLASRVARALGIDEVYANKLVCDERGRLSPRGVEVVNPLKKGEVVRALAAKHGVPLLETMYVGDSPWDCSALEVVGVPVVVGDPSVRCGSRELIHVPDLRGLLRLLRGLLGS